MAEPSLLMRWVMFHFAGGDALLIATLVIVGISVWERNSTVTWRWTLLTAVTAIWGYLGSPAWHPEPIWAAAFVLVGWRAAIHFRRAENLAVIKGLSWFVRGLCLLIAITEALVGRPAPLKLPPQTVCVIADSVTAGLDDGEATWPRHLAEEVGVTVRDASQPGATLKSALKQAEALHDDESPLVLEIGGNDLLSGLPLDQFRHDLERLCERVCTPGRVVWMCELPLPPLCSRYGAEQRRVCSKFDIRLISRRKLMGLLTTLGATVDSIHLSAKGQQLFLTLILRETGLGQFPGQGEYLRCER